MASQDDKRAGQPEALGIIQQAAMATVAPVETKGTSPRYLEVLVGTWRYLLAQWFPWDSRHDGGTDSTREWEEWGA